MPRFMAELVARGSAIAEAVSLQNGMPVTLANMPEAQFPAGVLQYYASLADSITASESRPSQMGQETLVEPAPVGVVAAVVPWYFPVTLAFSQMARAMLSCCPLVIKTPPGTALASYLVDHCALAAGVPP